MFNKDYTIVINNDNGTEALLEFMTHINKYGRVKNVAVNSEVGWRVIKLRTTVHRWNALVAKLKKLDLTPVKVNGFWFI